jgi:hypothetical protein
MTENDVLAVLFRKLYWPADADGRTRVVLDLSAAIEAVTSEDEHLRIARSLDLVLRCSAGDRN